MKFINIIDPIHDFIKLNLHEIEIIDNPIFQRLRKIKQLSGAHLVYPSAMHSRFEHSLGVLHVANFISITLYEKGILNNDDIKKIRLAALLHDIGHGPFSHLFEEILIEKRCMSHEKIGNEVIQYTEIGDILSKHGFDKRQISDIAFGNSKTQFINEIISGALSADIMDYLLRDGYFTGAEHAKIDHKRIVQSLGIHNDRLSLEKSAIYSFESMMHSRYQMFRTVYFHKTVRSAEVMLLNSIKSSFDELGLAELNIDNYLKLDDYSMLLKILNLIPSKTTKYAKKLAKNYVDRILLKCVFEKYLHDNDTNITSYELVKSISDTSKVDPSKIFIDRSTTSSMPLTPSKHEYDSITLTSNNNLEIQKTPVSKIPLISTLTGSMNILRIYTFREYKKKVEIAARSIFNTNETKNSN
ncbi:MAG: HD domain-containing protein [Nitrosopumilaceae archaeon]|nr:HD domain-containing protein [Nitrosopumilaceae archaeon]